MTPSAVTLTPHLETSQYRLVLNICQIVWDFQLFHQMKSNQMIGRISLIPPLLRHDEIILKIITDETFTLSKGVEIIV